MVGVGGRSILPACGGKTQTNGSDESYLGRFPFVRSGRPKRTGSGQFQWKGTRVHFPAKTLPIPALWPTGAGKLNGSDS